MGRIRAHVPRTSLISLAGCILIGYPVAYYIARHASRTKSLLLILLVLPFWISYLMRMLAWINLLAPGGYAARFLESTHISDLLYHMGLLSQPNNYLGGQSFTVIFALIYGYIPYFILPLYASLDRIDRSPPGGRARPRRQPVPAPSGTSRCRCRRPACWAARC